MQSYLNAKQLALLTGEGAVQSVRILPEGPKWFILVNGKAVGATRGHKRLFTQLDVAARFLRNNGIELFDVDVREWADPGDRKTLREQRAGAPLQGPRETGTRP